MEGWSADTWAAVSAASVAGTGAFLAALRWAAARLILGGSTAYERGWERVGELEEEVRLLRIALHKATQRGNTGWTVSEILSLAMPLPLEDRIRAVRQARQIAEDASGESR